MKDKPKRIWKILRRTGIVVAALFLLGCVSTYLGTLETLRTEERDIFSRIGEGVLCLSAVALIIWASSLHGKLKDVQAKEEANFVFRFSRRFSQWALAGDSVLAELVLDYGLSDSDVERLVRNGVHEAVAEYRKSHPLDHRPPSYYVDGTDFF